MQRHSIFQAKHATQESTFTQLYWPQCIYPIKPSPYEYAVLSNHVYRTDVKSNDIVHIKKKKHYNEHLLPNWRVLKTIQDEKGLYARLYINDKNKQIVLAFRGTVKTSLKDISEDFWGVLKGKTTERQALSVTVALEALMTLKKQEIYRDYHFSITGHSLGAWLASIATFSAKDKHHEHIPAVTFENPGAFTKLDEMTTGLNKDDKNILLNKELDLTNYLSAPNWINCAHPQVGTTYRMVFDPHAADRLSNEAVNKRKALMQNKLTVDTLATHNMDNILHQFDSTTHQAKPNVLRQVIKWPRIDWKTQKTSVMTTVQFVATAMNAPVGVKVTLKVIGIIESCVPANTLQDFWEYSRNFEDYDPVKQSDLHQYLLTFKANYETKPYDPYSLPLRNVDAHLSTLLQEYLKADNQLTDTVDRWHTHALFGNCSLLNDSRLSIQKKNGKPFSLQLTSTKKNKESIDQFLNKLATWLNTPDGTDKDLPNNTAQFIPLLTQTEEAFFIPYLFPVVIQYLSPHEKENVQYALKQLHALVSINQQLGSWCGFIGLIPNGRISIQRNNI